MNENEEIHVPFSTIVILAILTLLVIGWSASPRNEDGRPMLLLTDVKAVENYRRLALDLKGELTLVDGEIAGTLGGDTTDLFGQTRQAQKAFEHIVQVVQEIDRHDAPPALVGLHEELTRVSIAYLE